MKACLALCMIAALVGAAHAFCNACLDGQCYRQHILPVSGVYSNPMDIDRNKNVLYVGDGKTMKQCQLDTQVCDSTTLKYDIHWLTVDQRTGDAYVIFDDKSGHGLYKFNLITNEESLLVNRTVQHIQFKDKLYYSPRSGNGIFIYENGESRMVEGTEEYYVWNFVVDKNDDIYIKVVVDGKYIIRRLSKGVINRKEYWKDAHTVTIDNDGNAVIMRSEKHAIVYKDTNGQLLEIGDVSEPVYPENMLLRPLYDRTNNIVYRNSRDFVYLKRDEDVGCYVTVFEGSRFLVETGPTNGTSVAGRDDEGVASHSTDQQEITCSCNGPIASNVKVKVNIN